MTKQLAMKMVGPPLTEADVSGLEQRTGHLLPRPYRTFLLRFNGGRPAPSDFDVPQWHHGHSSVNDFNAIAPGAYNDLENDLDLLEGRMPTDCIPIADDPGGNAILLATRGPHCGAVFFWDHEQEPDSPGDDWDNFRNIYRIADDFDSFLEALHDER
jgi:hypothetical protein